MLLTIINFNKRDCNIMVELASSSSKPLDTEVLLNPLNDRCVSESEIPLMPNKRLSLDRLYPLKANG